MKITNNTLLIYSNGCVEAELLIQSVNCLSFTNFNNFILPFSESDKSQIKFLLTNENILDIQLIADLNCRRTHFIIDKALSEVSAHSSITKSENDKNNLANITRFYIESQLENRKKELMEFLSGATFYNIVTHLIETQKE